MAQLLSLESMDPDRDISIYINSPGGSFTAMTAIYDTMQFIKPRDPDGLPRPGGLGRRGAARGRHARASARPAERRILIHQPYTEGGGQGSDIEIQANEILRMREQLEGMLADAHRASDHEQVSRDIERDKILTAEQAVEYGLIDEVLDSRKVASRRSPERPSARRHPTGRRARQSSGVGSCQRGADEVPSKDRRMPRASQHRTAATQTHRHQAGRTGG